jgi:hypothetical protein
MEAVADYVVAVTRAAYPDLDIPYHSRWRHFAVDGVDQWAPIAARIDDPTERARTAADLAVVSVLLDAGAGASWRYRDPVQGVASTPAGLAAIDELINDAICLPKEGINDDGSGVSHYSTHSARYWRHLLEAIRAQPWAAHFESELAISGRTGTMASRLNSPAVIGRVHAKTGTVRGGRALSGYATTVGGRAVVFSIIGNGDDTKLTTKVMDELVETIVSYTG